MRRRLARVLLVTCLTLIACDVTISLLVLRDGEVGWRPIPPLHALSSQRQRDWLAGQHAELDGRQKPGVIGVFDAELGWCNPSSRSTAPGVEPSYSYDALGARSEHEYAAAPPAGVVRLACFGESFTHCDEVGNRETWEAQLEGLDARYEALDFGVGGYGTDQALLRFRREGLHGARVACIGYMLENIGRNVNRYRPLWYPTTMSCGVKPRFVLDGDALHTVPAPYATRAALVDAIESGRVLTDLAEHEYWSAETHLDWLRFSAFLRLAAGWWCYHRRDVAGLYDDPRAEPYRVSLALLETFAREARARGAELAPVIVFPREPDLERLALSHDRFWTGFVAELGARGLDVIDVSDALVPAWLAARADPKLPRLFTNAHYSGAGNAIVAATLHEWLLKHAPAAR